MQSSAIYNYTKVYRVPSDHKQYQAMNTLAGKNYFLCPIPLSGILQLSIDNHQYRIIDQHISIYAEHQDNKPGLEAYHLTIRLVQAASEFIIHCYFDSKGIPSHHGTITMKQNHNHIQLSDIAQKYLQDYSIQTTGLIQMLNRSLMEKQCALQQAIEIKQLQVDELSKNFMHHLKPYAKALGDLIDLIKEFNFITNDSMQGELSLLVRTLSICEQSQIHSKTHAKKSKHKKNTKLKEAFTGKEIITSAPEEKKGETLESINKKLVSLKDGNLSSLQEQQRLQTIKLELIPAMDIENILRTIQQLHNLNNKIREHLFKLALQGDIEAANAIVAKKYFVSYNFYYSVVFHGQEKIFDILIAKCPISFVLLNSLLAFTTDNIPRSLLQVAYIKKHESLFRKLLLTYRCNPNLILFSGDRLIHQIAKDGAILYAKMMMDAGADINAMTIKADSITVADPRIENKQTAQEYQVETLKKLKENQNPKTTPLMQAAIHSKFDMVEYLVDHKADANLRGRLGLDAIGSHAATKNASLNASILLKLLQAGSSIDSINSLSEFEQFTPLDYRCQFLDEAGVHLLVNQFAADPNVLIIKGQYEGKGVAMTCLGKLISMTRSPETQEVATRILLFLLHQDIQPLVTDSAFNLSLTFLSKYFVSTLGEEEKAKQKAIFMTAWENHEYDTYYEHVQIVFSSYPSKLYQAFATNKIKLTLIKAAEEKLLKKEFQHCIHACQAVLSAKFTIEQYNERLWAAYYRAHLGLGDDENACKALEHYLRILTSKSVQVLAPHYKAEINKKIADASVELAEIHHRLLNRTASQIRVMHPAHLFYSKKLPEKTPSSKINTFFDLSANI